jgi:hypothetical protein
MDPETERRLIALVRKTAADIIADWKWPVWRRDDEQPRPEGDPPRG